jgi:hypothetical protein
LIIGAAGAYRTVMMRQTCLTALLLLAAGCSKSPEEAELQNVQDAIAELAPDVSACDGLQQKDNEEAGERSKAEWDRAAAANIENVSPEQEAEIRASLGAELNIPPSKVDWKDIYRRRAEQAKIDMPTPAHDAYLAQCADYPEKRGRLDELHQREDDIRRRQDR